MRLTTTILLATFMQLSAATLAQRVTFEQKNVNIQTVFKEIRKQTGYDFIYSDDVIKKASQVNVKFKGVEVNQVLRELFQEQPLTYTVKHKIVVVNVKVPSFLDRVNTAFTDISLRGVVRNSGGAQLSGATVRIKGVEGSVRTDGQGNFVINSKEPTGVLVVSYLGFKTTEVVYSSTQTGPFTIILSEVAGELTEVSVVSTGYQNIPKDRATGSFNILSGEKLNRPSSDLSERLVGNAVGVVATTEATTGTSSFQIRGLTTLGASAAPLIVIDGFPVPESNFSQINPNNIESVTILKDAAAASIWGAKAANGVIVITTRTAKKGSPLQVELNSYLRLANKIDLNYARALASSSETVAYEQAIFGKIGPAPNSGVFTPPSNAIVLRSQAGTLLSEARAGFISADMLSTGLNQLNGFDNTQQIRDLLLNNPVTRHIDLNIAGSGERMTNNLAMLYETNQYDFKGNDRKKAQLNYKLTTSITRWLDFETSLEGQYVFNNNNSPLLAQAPYSTPGSNTLALIKRLSPYDMLVNSDGSYTNVINHWYMPIVNRNIPTAKFPYSDFTYNPVVDKSTHDVTTQQINARLQGGLTVKIMKGVTLSSRLQYSNFNSMNRGLFNEQSDIVRYMLNLNSIWNGTPNGTVTSIFPKGSILSQSRSQQTNYVWSNQLKIDRNFGTDHALNVILGTEMSQTRNQTFNNPHTFGYNDATLAVGGFTNGIGGTYPQAPTYKLNTWVYPAVTFPGINGNNLYSSFGYATEKLTSFFGNAAYTYKSKYTLSASARSDASNLITDDPKYRYAPFWSTGLLWRVSKENFLKKLSWLDDLTLRASYGESGNVDRSTSFQPLISIGSTVDGVTGELSNTISSYGNPTLRWERTNTINTGFDFSILRNKFFGSIEFYRKHGHDLIATVTIPSVNGSGSQRLNNAAMDNKGIELMLGTRMQISNNIDWTGSLNFAYNKNKIKQLFLASYSWETLAASPYVQGYDANTAWAATYAGLVNGYPSAVSSSGTVPLSTAAFTFSDGFAIGSPAGTRVPPYNLGFNNQFRFYDFNLSLTVTGKFGAVFRDMSFNYVPGVDGRVLPNARLKQATSGDQNYLQLPSAFNDPAYSNWTSWSNFFSYLYQSANVVRLQEANLSYNVNQSMINKLGLKGLQLYVQGQNLFTIVNNPYKQDPEYPEGSLKPTPRYTLGFRVQL